MTSSEPDPFQVFQVEQKPCYKLTVTILRGRNIIEAAQNYVDTPDPYVKVSLSSTLSPNVKISLQTDTQENEGSPVWNYTLSFFVDIKKTNILHMELFDEDLGADAIIGTKVFNLLELERGKLTPKTFKLESQNAKHKCPAEIDAEFLIEQDFNPDLRFSMCLCDEEKEFLVKRKEHVFESMKNFFKDQAPKSIHDMPGIGVVHSGGGFRGMLATCGVFRGLHEAGLLDLITYMSGLSGSTWYMSHLFTNPDWQAGLPDTLTKELKPGVTSSFPSRLLRPDFFYKNIKALKEKRNSGQPISFTDFFGYVLGQTLEPSRSEAKLSDQAALLKTGKVPMPIFTAATVKHDVVATEFHEWVECSAFEVALAKYGIAMKTEHFGSKFFMGRVVKQYQEPPLHFFQGIWGSVWGINLKNMVTRLRKYNVCCFGSNKVDDDNTIDHEAERVLIAKKIKADLQERTDEVKEDIVTLNEKIGTVAVDNDETVPEWYQTLHKSAKKNALEMEQKIRKETGGQQKPKNENKEEEPGTMNWLDQIVKLLEENSSYIGGKAGRAPQIFNYLNGLELKKSYPVSPFTRLGSEKNGKLEFPFLQMAMDTEQEHVCIVDAGVAFKLPFPPLLRPQRDIDVFMSFEYSLRKTDYGPDVIFEALKTAEKWAKINGAPFPKIDEKIYEREGMKEVYLFEEPDDPLCPIVLHFPLVNLSFKDFKAPGVRRETKEEKEYGNFNVVGDGEYTTLRLTYNEYDFGRMVDLMAYNVLNNSQVIKKAIMKKICVKIKQIELKEAVYRNVLNNYPQ